MKLFNMKLFKPKKLVKLTFTGDVTVLFSEKQHTYLTPIVSIPANKVRIREVLSHASYLRVSSFKENPDQDYFFAKTCWEIQGPFPDTGFNSIATTRHTRTSSSHFVSVLEYVESTIGLQDAYTSSHSTEGSALEMGFIKTEPQTLLKVERVSGSYSKSLLQAALSSLHYLISILSIGETHL